MRRHLVLALLTSNLVSTYSHAGIGDSLRNLAGKCSDLQNSFNDRVISAITSELAPKLESVPNTAATILGQIRSLSCASGDCAITVSTTLTKEGALALWRIYRFNSQLDDIKEHIVIPLVGDLRIIRKNLNSNNQEVARAVTRLIVYSVETEIKLSKMLSESITVKPVAIATGVATGNMLPVLNSSNAAEEVAQIFVRRVFGHVWNALFSANLSWAERAEQLASVETFIQKFMGDINKAVGWNELEAELAKWERDHQGGKNENESPEPSEKPLDN